MICIVCKKERGSIRSSQNICSYCIRTITNNARENTSVEEVVTYLQTVLLYKEVDEINDGHTIERMIEYKDRKDTGYEIARNLFLNYMRNRWDNKFEDLASKAEVTK